MITQAYFKDMIPTDFKNYVKNRETQMARIGNCNADNVHCADEFNGRNIEFSIKLNVN